MIIQMEYFLNVSFHHNTASIGAAILANDHCNITLAGNSSLLLADNEASQCGGGGYLNNSCNCIMQENASVTVDSNKALEAYALKIKPKYYSERIPIYCSAKM